MSADLSDAQPQEPCSQVLLGKEVLTIDFKPGGNASLFKVAGWHWSEVSGTWTDGTSAKIRIPSAGPNTGYHCTMLLLPYLEADRLPAQELIILAGGQQVFREMITAGGFYTFNIPATAKSPGEWIDVTLQCPSATSPSAVTHSSDSRTIAFLVNSITLIPVPSAETATASPLSDATRDDATLNSNVSVGDARSPKSLAVVTMAYNEPDYLPIWLAYYGKQVGLEHCYIIDHGSNDSSTEIALTANRIRIPRSPLDEDRRADFVSKFCSSLLNWYDFVIYCDVDEIIVADPNKYDNLLEFCRYSRSDVVTPVGMNLVQRLHEEPALDTSRPILSQRQWLVPTASMCKPALTRVPIKWGPGFHSSDGPLTFDQLFTFHLPYVDVEIVKRRQTKRRGTPFSASFAAQAKDHHHHAGDERLLRLMDTWSRMPLVYDVDLTEACRHKNEFIGRVYSSYVGGDDRPFKIDLGIWGSKLWRLPARFLDRF